MAKVIGIDPGTMSMDLLGFDDVTLQVFLDESIPRELVTRNPRIVVERVEEASRRVGGVDAIIAPSGYGLPLMRVQEASLEDIAEATFVTREDVERRLRIIGLREVMKAFRESRLPAWFTPGVIHLESVPEYRKANRIDMGTADKVFTVAAALANLYDEDVDPRSVNAIVVEIGYAYTAAIAVEKGRIVDGVGGTSGFTGYLGMGFMDAELAYTLAAVEPRFSKTRLFEGGAAFIAGIEDPRDLEGFVEKGLQGYEPYSSALQSLVEAVLKDIGVLLAVLHKPRWIFLSGRWTRIKGFLGLVEGRIREWLSEYGLSVDVRVVRSLGRETKAAAYGAAVLASGIVGGRYKPVFDSLGLRDSRGSIFDHILLSGGIREKIRREFRSVR